jgi:hypothetical protein
MSTAYPEGEVFFVRNSLKAGTYDPNRAAHFYKYFLLEIIVNDLAEFPGGASGTVHQHPYTVQKKKKFPGYHQSPLLINGGTGSLLDMAKRVTYSAPGTGAMMQSSRFLGSMWSVVGPQKFV